jgi:hypothetical protein
MLKSKIVIIAAIVIGLIYLFYRHDKCMSGVSTIYYSHAMLKDIKYGYFLRDGKYEGLRVIDDCREIQNMQAYYRGKSSSIDFEGGYLQPFRRLEILDYYYDDSTAIIRTYHTPRLNRIGSVIVSMHCLHDTLPAGKKELVGW